MTIRHLRVTCAAAVCLTATAVPLVAQRQPPAEIARLREWAEASRLVGLSVVRITPESQAGFGIGTATVGGGPSVQLTSLFEIGSITKGFTGLVLADLVLRGVVSLDDPVTRHLPSGWTVPSFDGHPITLRDLATHTSGLPRMPPAFLPSDLEDPYAPMNDDSLRAHLAAARVTRAPGTYAYSNLGMAVLGRAVAHAGGASWWELVQRRVLEPLRMADTWFTVPPGEADRMVSGHTPEFVRVPRWHFDAYAPAGGLVSTGVSLSALVEALARPDTGTAIGRAIVLATTPLRSTGAGLDSVALGWHIQHRGDTRIIWHNGGTGGFRTWLGAVRGERRGAVVLSNAVLPWVDRLGASLVSGDTIPAPPVVTPRSIIDLPAGVLEEYVGRYPISSVFALTVTREGDGLRVQATGQPRARLIPVARDRFILPAVPGAELRFVRSDAGGPPDEVELHQNGGVQRGTRQR